jgi:hypothetical protein
MFLSVGIITIVSAPVVYWRLDNGITSARFFNDHERDQATERLRANQTGTDSHDFKWSHIVELALEPKSYLFIGMTLLLNLNAQVTNTFGPLILSGIGFDKLTTSLLNIPFGLIQFLSILVGSWAAQKSRYKSFVMIVFMLPVVLGIMLLYTLARTAREQVPLMVGYYLLACLFAANPLIVSWILGNTAGTTKISGMMACYQGSSGLGNIIGPLFFKPEDAPSYHPGLRVVLGGSVLLLIIVLGQLVNLMVLNRMQEKKRVQSGKKAVLHDRSMDEQFVSYDDDNETEDSQQQSMAAALDLTDRKNPDFIYIY